MPLGGSVKALDKFWADAGSEILKLGGKSGGGNGAGKGGAVALLGAGKLPNATAAQHSENKLKFCGQARGMSSGELSLRTAWRCSGLRD